MPLFQAFKTTFNSCWSNQTTKLNFSFWQSISQSESSYSLHFLQCQLSWHCLKISQAQCHAGASAQHQCTLCQGLWPWISSIYSTGYSSNRSQHETVWANSRQFARARSSLSIPIHSQTLQNDQWNNIIFAVNLKQIKLTCWSCCTAAEFKIKSKFVPLQDQCRSSGNNSQTRRLFQKKIEGFDWKINGRAYWGGIRQVLDVLDWQAQRNFVSVLAAVYSGCESPWNVKWSLLSYLFAQSFHHLLVCE